MPMYQRPPFWRMPRTRQDPDSDERPTGCYVPGYHKYGAQRYANVSFILLKAVDRSLRMSMYHRPPFWRMPRTRQDPDSDERPTGCYVPGYHKYGAQRYANVSFILLEAVDRSLRMPSTRGPVLLHAEDPAGP
ncbi:hypothetical protein O0L34_g14356 [Tuta absoluta]|nr:hypothetical protein O0L34_g14356 [Tuta absoluta]